MRAVVLALVCLLRTAHAADCASESSGLRSHLVREQHRGDAWTLDWRLTFPSATAASLSFGLLTSSDYLREGAYVSAGKAGLATLTRWIFPLHVRMPEETADACVDLAALRKETRRIGTLERRFFWMGHIGGIALNLGGAALLWSRSTLSQGLISIAVGYPVGVIHTYTMPRGSWQRSREAGASWDVVVLPVERGGWTAGVAGAF